VNKCILLIIFFSSCSLNENNTIDTSLYSKIDSLFHNLNSDSVLTEYYVVARAFKDDRERKFISIWLQPGFPESIITQEGLIRVDLSNTSFFIINKTNVILMNDPIETELMLFKQYRKSSKSILSEKQNYYARIRSKGPPMTSREIHYFTFLYRDGRLVETISRIPTKYKSEKIIANFN